MARETRDTRENPLSTEAALSAPPRRVLIVALLRSLLSVVVVVTIYFRLPLSNLSESRTIIEFVIGLLLVVVVLAGQVLAILRSPYPLTRTVEALSTTGPFFLILFAITHFVIAGAEPGSYSQQMTRLDALYFTVTTFATVGYGDISPASQGARFVALLQMVLGLILVGVIARVITGAAQLGMKRHRTERDQNGGSRSSAG
jgi:voltage-gated potassium channel